jgi:MFS family permease
MTSPDAIRAPQARPQRTARPGMLAVLLTATFMGQFDFFVVNVAAPTIRHDLRASESGLQLIVGGYAFAYAAALVLGGRLGDLFGRRRMFIVGMLGFTVTSALCSIATNQGELVAARLAQGLTAAMMLPQVLAVISATTDVTERPRAMAWYGVAAGAGAIAGQVFGGLLVTADVAGLGWRLIFLVNVPVGVVGAFLARRAVPESGRAAGRPALDPLGALGLAVSLALALVPLTMGPAVGWPWWTWLSMAAAVPALAATLWWQQAQRRRGGSPLLDLSLFRAPSFRTGFMANFAFMASFASYMFTLALLLQVGLRLDAFRAGLVFAPAGLGFSLASLLAPRLVRRYGQATVAAGAVTAASGLAALGFIAVTDASSAPVAWITACAVVISLGNGVVLPSLIGAALRDVPPAQAGAAAGALTTGQQFAGAAGVAGIGTLYFTTASAGQGTAMAWAAGADAVLILVVAGLVLARAVATTKAQSAARAGIAARTPASPTSPTGRADPMPGTRSRAGSDRP